LGTVVYLKSSVAVFAAQTFEAIQRYSTRLRCSDEYTEVEFPTFCSGEVIGCSVEKEKGSSEAAIDFDRLSAFPVFG
jgi:hypothetical protein